jgi:hypothetical protein
MVRSGPRWKRWRPVGAGIAVCATVAALAGPSAALKVMCSPNSNGTQTCQGTDSFTYDGENNAGCPPAGTVETVTINEDVTSDATNVTGTWGVDPATICGGITDANGVAYRQGDTLRGGGFTVVNGKRVWQWTVKVQGKSPSGDHPQVVVHVTYDRPTTSTGGGGGNNGGGSGNGGGGTGSTGFGVCDWSVSFDDPPTHATSVPVGYHLTVRNTGTGPCPPTSLKIRNERGVDTALAHLVAGAPGSHADPLVLFIPGLAPGGSVHVDVLARPKIADLGMTGNRIRLRASLPPDEDSPNGGDDYAIAKTKLKPKPIDVTGGQTDAHGHGTLMLDCPAGEHKHDHCTFTLDFPAATLPQERLLIPPFAEAKGIVPAGHEGELHFRLREAGLRILRHGRGDRVTIIGTRTEDGQTIVVETHLFVKR